MNNPNPFVPKGSLLDQQSQRRSRLKLAVFCVLTVCVGSLVVMLIQGCKREQPATDTNPPPPDANANAMPGGNASPPPPDNSSNATVAMAQSNSVPPPPPVPVPVPVTPPTPPAPTPVEPAAGTEYVIAKGDILANIAKSQGVTLKALLAANPGVDPKKLKIGQKIAIPAKTTEATSTPAATAAGTTEAGGETYVVKSGDTLSKIAKKNGVTLKALRAANPKIASTDHIKVGEKLAIPAKTEAAAPAAPAPETPAAPVTPPSPNPAPAAPAPGH